MGRIFLEHIDGSPSYSCAACDTILTSGDNLVSTEFKGITGRAFLFKRVINLKYSGVQDRIMSTGRHIVRDVFCKSCDAKLGWTYEFATEASEKYKEGQVILEKALITLRGVGDLEEDEEEDEEDDEEFEEEEDPLEELEN